MTPELENRFRYHAPKDAVKLLHATTRAECRTLAEFITNHTPASREQALALTHIETAMFWANAAIARNNTDSQDDAHNPTKENQE